MIKNKTPVYIQDCDGVPFAPEYIARAGYEHGVKTKQGEVNVDQLNFTRFAVAEHKTGEIYEKKYFRFCEWSTYNDKPLIRFWEPLTFEEYT